ncbi:unnamed protein product [marine sediment metagenome]|uniref:Uncharacterized protein n=1 Tax=marine sediment metagenome TaxID=412755 RepID=X1SVB8_9ZZZZ
MGDDVFRYSYAAEAIKSGWGGFNDGTRIHEAGGAIAEHAVGATLINFDCADVVAENGLQGGYVCRYVAPAFRCRIKSNLKTAAGILAITLRDPLPVVIGVTEWIAAYPSIYSRILKAGGVSAAAGFMAVVCVPLIDVAAGRYFWGLTWGPFPGPCGIYGNLIGKTAGQRTVHFDGVGELVYRPGSEATDAHLQPAGYLLFDGRVLTYGDQLVMLQLAP